MIDEVADTYVDSLRQNHRFIPGSTNWYGEYKVRITSNLSSSSSRSILDFGCRIGLSVPHLHNFFPVKKYLKKIVQLIQLILH